MKKIAFILLAAVLLIIGSAFLFLHTLPATEKRIADGTVLRLEKLTFGKREPYIPGNWLQKFKLRAMRWIPARWNKTPPPTSVPNQTSWNQVSIIHTNEDALQLWVSRFNPVSGVYEDAGVRMAELVDSHGCPLLATQIGGAELRGTNAWKVTWLTFEAFPRHEKQFHLRLYDGSNDTSLAEFVIGNPMTEPAAVAAWKVEPLPITRREGDVTITLTGVTIRSNAGFARAQWPNEKVSREIVPAFAITEKGAPSAEWQLLDFDLYDSSGNFASERPSRSRFLCVEESAWKMSARFYGSEKAINATNESWTIKGLKLPGPGQFTALEEAHTLGSAQLTLLSIAGPGDFTYGAVSPPAGGQPPVAGRRGGRQVVQPISGSVRSDPQQKNSKGSGLHVSFGAPHIAVDLGTAVGSAFDDEVLTIHAKDDQGRECDAYEWGMNGAYEAHYVYRRADQNPAYLVLDLPPDSKTVDLIFTVHVPRTVEFIFKPPQLNSK